MATEYVLTWTDAEGERQERRFDVEVAGRIPEMIRVQLPEDATNVRLQPADGDDTGGND